jgi:UDPglucose--hexose-1-phosphate uridylyltransferase
MPDFRYDPIAARWVAIASNRESRPVEFVPLGERLDSGIRCPFCAGAEDETPTQLEVWDHEGQRIETTDSDVKWSTRVVPNKFPAFPADAPLSPYDTAVLDDLNEDFGPYQQHRQSGVQELIIPSPRHVSSFAQLKKSEAMICWAACQTRIGVLRKKRGLAHAMLFMNCRSAAGATLAHAHLQLIGSPMASRAMKDRVRRNQKHVEEHGRTLLQSAIEWERKQKARIVLETDYFTVVCPFASRVAYQMWIVPKEMTSDFVAADRKIRDELALICRQLTQRLDRTLNEPAYNLLLLTAPFDGDSNDHWYVEIMPRLTRGAGLEWGTDIWINPVSPEDAAKRLRS